LCQLDLDALLHSNCVQAPATCSDAFVQQLQRIYAVPPALAAAAAAPPASPSANIFVRAGCPMPAGSQSGGCSGLSRQPSTAGSGAGSAHSRGGSGSAFNSPLRQPQGGPRYDPHTPPVAPSFPPVVAGSTPGGASVNTPSAPMLPRNGGSSSDDVPGALDAVWHGGGGDAGQTGGGDPQPGWRRNNAYDSVADMSPYNAAAAAQLRPSGARPASHPVAFGSYTGSAELPSPAGARLPDGGPPPSRPAAYPDASPTASPFRTRQVPPSGENLCLPIAEPASAASRCTLVCRRILQSCPLCITTSCSQQALNNPCVYPPGAL